VTIATLDQGLPDVQEFRDLDFSEPTRIMDGAASGIAAAAELYLGKKLDELTVSEAALLAAIPQSPATLHPWATDAKGHCTNIVKEPYGKKVKGTGKAWTHLVVRTCTPDDAKPGFTDKRAGCIVPIQ
jgi:hypothetical protein